MSVERFVEEACDFGIEIILRPAALKAFEALVIEPEVLESGGGVLVWQKVWGKGAADLTSSNLWSQVFRLLLSAVGRGAR